MKYMYLVMGLIVPALVLTRLSLGRVWILRFLVYGSVMTLATMLKGAETHWTIDFLANRLEHGLVLAMATGIVMELIIREGQVKTNTLGFVLLGLGISAVIGLGIEMVQLAMRLSHLSHFPNLALGKYIDTLWDLGADLAGGVLGALVVSQGTLTKYGERVKMPPGLPPPQDQ